MKPPRSFARAAMLVAVLLLPQAGSPPVTSALAAAAPCTASNISGGDTYSAAISNGQLFTWGRNVEGELGLGFTSTQVLTPTAVSSNPLLTNVTGVWAGFLTTFAVDPSGQLWSWGTNVNSQTGTGAASSSPVPVSGPTNVVSVGAAHSHTIVATADGTVWGWGQSSGLGAGDTFFTQVNPVVLQTPPHVVKVFAGNARSLVLTSDGALYGAGNNLALGIPTVQFVPTFTLVPNLPAIVDVSMSRSLGAAFSLFVDSSGHVWAVGDNSFGQLGTGTVGDPLSSRTPLEVQGIDSVIQVAAGNSHALALKSDGTVWAWGLNQDGQLGIGSTDPTGTPMQVHFPSGTELVRIAAGIVHSMAVDSNGNIWVWGNDQLGALGTGVANHNEPTPVKISLAASCPGLPPPPTAPTVGSLSPSFGQAAGSTTVTIIGSNFTNAETVQFGNGQPLLPPCVSTSSRYCFTVVDDTHITAFTLPHAPGSVDVSVSNVAGSSDTSPADVYWYEGWIYPTPTDKSSFDIPIGTNTSFTVKALEQGPMTIGWSAQFGAITCSPVSNPGQPAEVTCTVLAQHIGLSVVTFFDAADPSRIALRRYVIGRGEYAELGDSYSSGEGNRDPDTHLFLTNTFRDGNSYNSDADHCNRSLISDSHMVSIALYGGDTTGFVACSGATINQVMSANHHEPKQLDALTDSTDLVTISIGGDDIGFADVATACIIGLDLLGGGCEFIKQKAVNDALARIGNETAPGGTLDNLFKEIRARAPHARILVVGYPNLLPSFAVFTGCPLVRIRSDEVGWLQSVERQLNDTIQFEAERSGVEFVAGTTTAFANHELCTLDTYVLGLEQLAFNQQPLHPNEKGQRAMADAIRAQIAAGPPGYETVIPFGQSITTSATVSPGMGMASFSTTWPGSDVGMTLTTPSGRQITRSTSAADVYHVLGPTYETFTIANPEAGTWTIQLTGTDVSVDGEPVRLSTAQLPHVNAAPTANLTASLASGTAPLSVAFNGSTSFDPDGAISSYAWDFHDGTTATGATPSHVFGAPGTYVVTLTVTDNSGALGFDETTITVREPTRLVYSGDTSGDYNDTARLAATLTSSRTGNPISGATVNLNLTGAGGTQGCTATTDSNGVASCTPAIALSAGTYTVTAQLAQTDLLAAATATQPFTVRPEETVVLYTGAPALAGGASAPLTATLLEDGSAPIAFRTVTFVLGSGSTAQTCTSTTTSAGVATCNVSVNQALGPVALQVSFQSDGFYAAASTTTSVVVFAYASGGGFVVGDTSAGVPTPVNGASVMFWGAQWSSNNALTGGAGPSDFLGFQNSLVTPVCGMSWSGTPAVSGNPPATVPAYMAVVVTNRVNESGSTITGTVVHVVIVHVAPGYGPNGGHPGSGTIVAVLC